MPFWLRYPNAARHYHAPLLCNVLGSGWFSSRRSFIAVMRATTTWVPPPRYLTVLPFLGDTLTPRCCYYAIYADLTVAVYCLPAGCSLTIITFVAWFPVHYTTLYPRLLFLTDTSCLHLCSIPW